RSHGGPPNRLDEARLLQETLDEEGRADRRLTEIAESHINDDARLEADFQQEPRTGRLRHVPMELVLKRRESAEPLAVRNDTDEELGVLDGLLAEMDLGAGRYALVDAGGGLGRRRDLPPTRSPRF